MLGEQLEHVEIAVNWVLGGVLKHLAEFVYGKKDRSMTFYIRE